MFVKDGKIVILLDNGHQHDAEEEKEKKIQIFSNNFLLRELNSSKPGKLDQIYIPKS
jgi:hypothetical protein